MLQIFRAVASGECSIQLAKMKPGKMHHARWLTTANRILRLYIADESPSDGLLVLVKYIMNVYVPVWLNIKMNPSAIYGAKHLFSLISKSRLLTDDNLDTVNHVIQNNAYFAHPENVLLAMIHDDSATIRELGFRRIMKARNTHAKRKSVIKFKQPKLLLLASEYHLMIDWHTAELTEPPATKIIPTENIAAYIRSQQKPCALTTFPCHTQAVERHIKLVTEASVSVVGAVARDGYIRNRIKGRKKNYPHLKQRKSIL